MDNSRLSAKRLETMVTGTRTRGRPKKRWKENIKEDKQKGGRNIRQAVEYSLRLCGVINMNMLKTGINGRRSSVQPHRRQNTGEDGRAKR